MGLLRSMDLGLPVDPDDSVPSPEGATFLDPRMSTTGNES